MNKQTSEEIKAVIKIIGIGGSGINAVNRMIESGLQGIETIAIDFDSQSLERSNATLKLEVKSIYNRLIFPEPEIVFNKEIGNGGGDISDCGGLFPLKDDFKGSGSSVSPVARFFNFYANFFPHGFHRVVHASNCPNLCIEIVLFDYFLQPWSAHNLFLQGVKPGSRIRCDSCLHVLVGYFLRLHQDEGARLVDLGCFYAVTHGGHGEDEKGYNHVPETSPESLDEVLEGYTFFWNHFNSPNYPWSVVCCQLLTF